MPNDRAKQFMPFDALKGFREALEEKEKEKEERTTLNDEKNNEINNILLKLKTGNKIKITYYEDYKYITKTIIIKKISFNSQKIFLNNNVIDFEDIKDIKIID